MGRLLKEMVLLSMVANWGKSYYRAQLGCIYPLRMFSSFLEGLFEWCGYWEARGLEFLQYRMLQCALSNPTILITAWPPMSSPSKKILLSTSLSKLSMINLDNTKLLIVNFCVTLKTWGLGRAYNILGFPSIKVDACYICMFSGYIEN